MREDLLLDGISSGRARLWASMSLEFQERRGWPDEPAMIEHGVSLKMQTALEHDPENWEPVCRLFRAVPGSPHHGRQVFIDVG
jgi:hypothetical protein